MEFCSNIAILQSALQFANQGCELLTYTRESSPSTLALIQNTIREITEDLCREEPGLTHLKIVTVLLSKALLTTSLTYHQDTVSWLEEWEALLYGLPDVSWSFVLDVINTTQLWPCVFQLLPHLPETAATQLLMEILHYLIPDPMTSDLNITTLVSVLAYISLHWKSPIFTKKYIGENDIHSDGNVPSKKQQDLMNIRSSKHQMNRKFTESTVWEMFAEVNEVTVNDNKMNELIQLLLEAFRKLPWKSMSGTDRVLAEFAVYNVHGNVYCRKGRVLGEVSSRSRCDSDGISPISMLLDHLRCPETDPDTVEVLLSEIYPDELCLMSVEPRKHLGADFSFLMELVRTDLEVPQWLELLYGVNPARFILGENKIYQHLWKRLCREILLYQCKTLLESCTDKITDEQTTEQITEQITQSAILDWEKKVCNHIEQEIEREGLYCRHGNQRLRRAIILIRHKVTGWKEQLHWMLTITDPDILTQPGWLSCMELCESSLNQCDLIIQGVRQLMGITDGHVLSADGINTLRKLLCSSFSQCVPEIQNTVLQDLSGSYSSADLDRVFGVDESLLSRLRTILNKLTNDNLHTCLPVLSSMMVQTPHSVLQAMVQAAVHNRAQITALVQVIRTMPAIIAFSPDSCSHGNHVNNSNHGNIGKHGNSLVTMINNLIEEGNSLSKREEKNLVTFCTQLMLPYQLLTDTELCHPLITHTQFLHHFLLPRLLSPDVVHNKSIYHSLFRVAMQTLSSIASHWLDLVRESRPIMHLYVVLCAVDRNDDYRRYVKIFSRSDWLDCLALLTEVLEKYPSLITDSDLAWLSDNCRGFHWSTKWFCYYIFNNVSDQLTIKMDVPQVLCQLVELPEGSQPCEASTNGWFSLLQFVAISNVTLSLTLYGLKDNLSDLSLSELLLSFAMLLPEYTSGELSRVMRFLQHCIDSGSLDTGRLVVSSGGNVHTGVCSYQVLNQATQLYVNSTITQLSTTNSCVPHNWTSISTVITAAVKTTVLDEGISGSAALNDLCQCLIITCNLLYYWPDSNSASHILTLALDMVNQLDSLLQEHKIEKNSVADILDELIKFCDDIPIEDCQDSLRKAITSVKG